MQYPGFGALNGVTRIRHLTQFGGGAVNRSALDGAGYDIDGQCGEQQDEPYVGSCPDSDGRLPGSKWIRLLGDLGGGCTDCSLGDRAMQALLPGGKGESGAFDPDIRPIVNSRVVSGTQLAGTLLEYEFLDGSSELLEGLTPRVRQSSHLGRRGGHRHRLRDDDDRGPQRGRLP